MKVKKKIISIILFSAIMISGIYLITKTKNKQVITSEIFTLKDTSEINKILISKNDKKVKLEKRNNKWTVDDKYPADKKSINKMYQLLKYTTISKPVPASKKDSILEYLAKKGKTIEIFNDKNKKIKTLKIGKYDKKLKGTYILNPEIQEPFLANIPGLTNDLNYKWNTNPVYWLKPEIFSYKPKEIKEITLVYSDISEKSFKLIIYPDTAKIFILPENKQLKNISLKRIGSYLSYFMNVKFYSETKNADELVKKLKQTKPKAIIKVKDIYKNEKNVKLYEIINEKGKKNLNDMYAIINDKDIVKVKYADFDLILKKTDYFTN